MVLEASQKDLQSGLEQLEIHHDQHIRPYRDFETRLPEKAFDLSPLFPFHTRNRYLSYPGTLEPPLLPVVKWVPRAACLEASHDSWITLLFP